MRLLMRGLTLPCLAETAFDGFQVLPPVLVLPVSLGRKNERISCVQKVLKERVAFGC